MAYIMRRTLSKRILTVKFEEVGDEKELLHFLRAAMSMRPSYTAPPDIVKLMLELTRSGA